MGQNLTDHHWVFDAGESLPRERSECFGHDLHCTATGLAGLDIDLEPEFIALCPELALFTL